MPSEKSNASKRRRVAPASESSQDTETLLLSFRRWAESEGFWLHPQVAVVSVPGKGLGVVALNGPPLPVGMVLMRCPEAMGLRVPASAFFPQLKKLRGALMAAEEEQLSAIDELILSVGFELHLGTASRWAPYLALLPLTPSRELGVPLLWADTECVASTALGERIAAEREDLAVHYANVVAPALQLIGHTIAINCARDFARIGSVIRGYAFTDVHGTGHALPRLLPLVDMMNHSSVKPTVRVVLDTADSAASGPIDRTAPAAVGDGAIMATRTIVSLWPGDEAMLSYGRLTSLELLSRYGFVPEANPDDAVEVPTGVVWNHIAEWISSSTTGQAGDNAKSVASTQHTLEDMGLLDDDGIVGFRPDGRLPAEVCLMVRVACLHVEGPDAPLEPVAVSDASLAALAEELEVVMAVVGDDDDAHARAAAHIQMQHTLLQFPASDTHLEAQCLDTLGRRLLQQLAAPRGGRGCNAQAVALLASSAQIVTRCFPPRRH